MVKHPDTNGGRAQALRGGSLSQVSGWRDKIFDPGLNQMEREMNVLGDSTKV